MPRLKPSSLALFSGPSAREPAYPWPLAPLPCPIPLASVSPSHDFSRSHPPSLHASCNPPFSTHPFANLTTLPLSPLHPLSPLPSPQRHGQAAPPLPRLPIRGKGLPYRLLIPPSSPLPASPLPPFLPPPFPNPLPPIPPAPWASRAASPPPSWQRNGPTSMLSVLPPVPPSPLLLVRLQEWLRKGMARCKWGRRYWQCTLARAWWQQAGWWARGVGGKGREGGMGRGGGKGRWWWCGLRRGSWAHMRWLMWTWMCCPCMACVA
ncbi:unnamed protein product [Closterium sp. NIES-53]